MASSSVKVSPLVKDYLEFRKKKGENTSLDSALREILDEADQDWRGKAREYRQQQED